jgi:transposase
MVVAGRGVQRDRSKEQFWRRLLRLWRGKNLTIRDFCAEHDVSEASFYAWRRTIAERDRQGAAKPPTSKEDNQGAPVFVPVHVLPALAETPLEVVLGQGRIVRVSAGFDAATLRQLLAILEEGPSC